MCVCAMVKKYPDFNNLGDHSQFFFLKVLQEGEFSKVIFFEYLLQR